MKTLTAAALILLAAAPALAEPPPPPPPHGAMLRGDRPLPFAGMSEAGRRTMMAAMAPGDGADRADHDRVKAARDRMLTLLSADRLDTAAIHRAMDDEREASNGMRARRQAAMLSAVQGLSVADRRAFVADARAMRGRFEGRIGKWREHRGRGGQDDMPPPSM